MRNATPAYPAQLGFVASIMKLNIIFIIFFCLIVCKPQKPKLPVQFEKEEILVTLDSTEIKVEGKYYFKNRTDVQKLMKLFYPFPVDEKHYYPYYIEVKGLTFENKKDGITFDVRIKPFEEKEAVIIYLQKISARDAKYILTTTKEWNEPLEEAKFIVNVPASFNSTLSYKPDSITKKEGRIFYYMTKHNFLPDSDLVVRW